MTDQTPSERPEVPPFRPDLNLIGDMNKREKSDLRPKRRWFRRRERAA
jgi:hypothetical protein